MIDKELEKAIDQKIDKTFQTLSKDINDLNCKINSLNKEIKGQGKTLARIDRVLLGDKEYDDEGFIKMINYSYEYARKNNESKVVEKGLKAIDHYERWQKEGKWDSLDTMIDDTFVSKRVKVFFNLGSWAGIVGLITSLITLITLLKNAGLV